MKKLQIILMGYEWDRLIYLIKKNRPDKVILVCQNEPLHFPEETKEILDLANKMIKKIGFLINCEISKVKTHDFKESLNTLLNIVKKHKGYDITINVSAGNKILVSASIMLAQYFGCNLSYIVPKEYGYFKSNFYAKGVLKEIKIPTLNIAKLITPKKKEREIFLCLNDYPITLTELIEKYSKRKIKNINESRTIKSLFIYHLKKLTTKNLINMDNSSKNTTIWLTETGSFIKKIIGDI